MRSLLILLALCGASAAPARAHLAGYDIKRNRSWTRADSDATADKCDACLEAEDV